MADESKLIGPGTCPVCRQPRARFTLTKSNLVCVTCRQVSCGFQGFSRTDDCDEKLRALIGPAVAAAPEPPARISEKTPAAAAAVAKTLVPDPVPQKAKPSWGILGSFGHG